MHELLAPLYYAVGKLPVLVSPSTPFPVCSSRPIQKLMHKSCFWIDFDSIAESGSSGLDPLFSELCARSWVAADSWALFSSLMRSISHWYEWREPASPSPFSQGPIDLKPYISPIVQTCSNIQGVFLKSVDPVLHDAMQSAGVEPQMYGLYVSCPFPCFLLTYGMRKTMAPLTVHSRISDARSYDVVGWIVCQLVSHF